MVLWLSEDLGYVSSFFKYISGTDVAWDLLSRGGASALYLWALILSMMPSFWLSIFQLSLFSSGCAGTAIIYLKGPGSIDKHSLMFALCFDWLYMNKCYKMCFILDRFETVFQGRQDTSPQECYNFFFSEKIYALFLHLMQMHLFSQYFDFALHFFLRLR